jgi:hypothetical protein
MVFISLPPHQGFSYGTLFWSERRAGCCHGSQYQHIETESKIIRVSDPRLNRHRCARHCFPEKLIYKWWVFHIYISLQEGKTLDKWYSPTTTQQASELDSDFCSTPHVPPSCNKAAPWWGWSDQYYRKGEVWIAPLPYAPCFLYLVPCCGAKMWLNLSPSIVDY